jgi:chromosome segregation ATPase
MNKRKILGMTGRSLAALTLAVTGLYGQTQAKLREGITGALEETRATREQLAAAVDALHKLKNETGDLRPAYENLVQQYEKTQAAADVTRKRIAQMQDASQQYFGAWKSDIDTISNSGVKKASMKRWNTVQKEYGEALASLRKAADKFTPFLSNLGDVNTALKNDLSQKGLKSLSGVMKSAEKNHVNVRDEIMKAILSFEQMQTNLAPSAA